MRRKSIIMVAVCLFSLALFSQSGDVLSLEDAVALYEDDDAETGTGYNVMEIIKDLVAEDIDASTPDFKSDKNIYMHEYGWGYSGYTPLLYASQYGYIEIAKSLIAGGANIEARNDIFPRESCVIPGNDTPLMFAVANGHTEIVKILIEAGANLDAEEAMGGTALMEAASNEHTEIVKLLIEAGANLDIQNNTGMTALYFCAYGGHTDIVSILIEAGANLEAKDDEGFTALTWATQNGHADTVALLEKGRTAFQEIGKPYHTTDNLRLRQNEGTAGTPLFTLPKGTLVKVLAQGNEETIDSITANWVQVEVVSDTVSVQGTKIEKGSVGWCFGGYLGEF